MFGFHRFLLAVLVVFGHLDPDLRHDLNWTGTYAVFGFYVLSGYLMARVLGETYGYGISGLRKYLLNRALRIYPPYWVVLGAFALSMIVLPLSLQPIPDPWQFIPHTFESLALNIGLLGLHASYQPRLVSVGWSLHVELCFYLMMGLGLSRWRGGVIAWLIASLGYTAWLIHQDAVFADRYSTVAAASLPFALGAAVYSLGDRGRVPTWLALGTTLIFVAHALTSDFIWDGTRETGFYASLLLAVLCVHALRFVDPEDLPGWVLPLDRRLGDTAYIVFLSHGMVIYWMMGAFGYKRGLEAFWVGLPIVVVLSYGLHLVVEAPIERLRDLVRGRRSSAM